MLAGLSSLILECKTLKHSSFCEAPMISGASLLTGFPPALSGQFSRVKAKNPGPDPQVAGCPRLSLDPRSLLGQLFPACHLGARPSLPPSCLGAPGTPLPGVCCQIHSLLSYIQQPNSSLSKPRRLPISDPNQPTVALFLPERVCSQRYVLTTFPAQKIGLRLAF